VSCRVWEDLSSSVLFSFVGFGLVGFVCCIKLPFEEQRVRGGEEGCYRMQGDDLAVAAAAVPVTEEKVEESEENQQQQQPPPAQHEEAVSVFCGFGGLALLWRHFGCWGGGGCNTGICVWK
jgi:hypothetical protein